MSGARGGPLGVYVHWPFCKSKCPYCDFNSHVRDGIDQARWRQALLAELEHAAREAPGRRVETMFFGGGTPSLMEPETAAAVIARTKALWDAAPDLEITLEANPTSVEAERFALLADAGINRVSLGVQALDAGSLAFLGRQHSAGEAIEAIATARRHFARYSFDLIYARPGQTPQAWSAELERALALAGEKRLPSLPDVPTTAEAGFPDLRAGAIFGVYVAAGTPNPILQKLNATVNGIIVMPEVTEQLRKLGAEPNPKTVEQFSALIRKEIETWRDVVAKAKLPMEEY